MATKIAPIDNPAMTFSRPRLRAAALAGTLALWAGTASQAVAQDALDHACPVCHGRPGASVPPLAGLTEAQIADALRAYRDGTRSGTAMPRLSAALTDEDIAQLAARYGLRRP